jgi:hypothetical protein
VLTTLYLTIVTSTSTLRRTNSAAKFRQAFEPVLRVARLRKRSPGFHPAEISHGHPEIWRESAWRCPQRKAAQGCFKAQSTPRAARHAITVGSQAEPTQDAVCEPGSRRERGGPVAVRRTGASRGRSRSGGRPTASSPTPRQNVPANGGPAPAQAGMTVAANQLTSLPASQGMPCRAHGTSGHPSAGASKRARAWPRDGWTQR